MNKLNRIINRLMQAEAMPQPALVGAPGVDAADHILFSKTSGSQPPKRTVQGERRRPGSSSQSVGRAEAPKRDSRPPSSVPPPQKPPSSRPPTYGGGSTGGGSMGGGYMPTGGSSGSGGGFSLPGGSCLVYSMFGLGGLLLLILAAWLFGAFGSDEPQTAVNSQPGFGQVESGGNVDLPAIIEQTQPEAAPVPTIAPATYTGGLVVPEDSGVTPGQTWTIMLYQDGDDKVLEQDIFIDFNEAERVGSSDRVNIIAQLDRYRGGFSGDGDWDDTRRYRLVQDNNLNRIGSPHESIGEVNMADPNVLVDFVEWGIANFPADKYVLIMSDHGMGWPGGWTDPNPRTGAPRGAPITRAIGNAMYLQDIDAALETIRRDTGIDAFEMVGMDACLMAHVEVFTALTPHARYAVASQETEPAVGWAYTAFLDRLVRNPDMSGADLSRAIVETYITEDQRVTDPTARNEFVGRGPGGAPSEAQLSSQLARATTISAADLSHAPEVIDRLNDLALVLQNVDQRRVAEARTYAQSFTNIWGGGSQPSYIDMAHFAGLLIQATGDAQVQQATNDLFSALNRAIVAQKNGPQKPGATGLSIYFPNSQLYGSPVSGPQSYIPTSQRFADVSLWDDFLNFHYTGRAFRDTSGTLSIPDSAVRAPGAGDMTLGPVTLSGRVAAPGQPVTMSADLTGENIGYVYLFAGLYDRESNSIYMADTDYIQSSETRELNGVYYPDWGEGDFTLEFVWEPIVFAINDGANRVQALLEPLTYGVDPSEAIYTTDGLYTYADGNQREGQLQFTNGELEKVIVFSGEGLNASPREIIPTIGDQFTVYEKWMDLDSTGQVVRTETELGGTITFGEEPVIWEVLDAAIGDYTIGFIAEDLDGNRVESYADVQVE